MPTTTKNTRKTIECHDKVLKIKEYVRNTLFLQGACESVRLKDMLVHWKKILNKDNRPNSPFATKVLSIGHATTNGII